MVSLSARCCVPMTQYPIRAMSYPPAVPTK